MSRQSEQQNEILRELLRLQAEQTDLIRRLTALNLQAQVPVEEIPVAQVIPQEEPAVVPVPRIQVASRVRIINPRQNQASTGTVISIGRSLVTIRTNNGTTIRRAPHNLALI
jgi:hypothetical protein